MVAYLIGLATLAAITAVLVVGLNVRFGWAGEFDISYYAFVAIGAYTTGVLIGPPSGGPNAIVPPPNGWILGLHWPFLPSVVICVLFCGLLSALFGAVALRSLRGDYFAIVSVAFTLILTFVFSQDYQLFNGFFGIYDIPQPFASSLGNPSFFEYSLIFLAICLIALLIVYVIVERLYASPFGLTLRSIREDEQASAAFGHDVYMEKLKAFVVGGMIAGLGGSLFVVYLTSWNPSAWSAIEVFLLYAGIFIGGTGNTRGAIIGTVFVVVLIPEATRYLPTIASRPDLYPAMRNVLSGLIILAVLRWRPQGAFPERHLKVLASPRLQVAGASGEGGGDDGQ